MSFISAFDFISVVVPDPQMFLFIPASAADAATVNPNGIKTLLANDLTTFFMNGSPLFNNGPRSLPRNPPDFMILDNWVFDNLMPVGQLFVKTLQKFATCLLVNNDKD